MPCAPGRISSSSRQPGQRGGSLLSKRYFDPRTHKVYPGAPALFRNTEQRRIFVTLVTLEIDPWKFLAPSLRSQGSDSHLKNDAPESSSQSVSIFCEPGLQSEPKISPSDHSEILVDSIPEADRPVNCVSRRKRKKKGKHQKKSVPKTVSTVLATQREERDIPQTEESDMPENFSLVSNRVIASSSPESREIVQAVCGDILSGSSSCSSLDKDTFCSTSGTSYDKDDAECITYCSSNQMWQKNDCDTLCNTERAGNSCQASSSDGFQPVINRKRSWLNKRASQNLNGIHRFGRHDMIGKDRVYKNEGRDSLNTSIGSNKNGRNSGDPSQTSQTAKLTASTCREYKVPEMLNRKKYSEVLLGNNTAPKVSHTGMGTSSQLTENAVSCQPGSCETQISAEEDITSEGAHSTVTDTSEVTPSTVTGTSEGTLTIATDTQIIVEEDITSEGTHSTVTDTSEVTPSTVTGTSEGTLSIATDTKDMLQDLCLADSEDHKYELDSALLTTEKKDSLAADIGGTGSLAAVVDESVSSCHDISAESNSCLMHEVKEQCFSGFETDLGKIVQVVEDSYRLQTIAEGVRLVTGSPVAEFEKFVLSATPVLDKLTCSTCSPDQFIGDSFCGHQFPNIPLKNLWQWYDKLGSYGVEVKAMDYSPHKSRKGGFGFRAYFVPYLSAIQLFGRCRSSAGSNSHSNKKVREGGVSDEGSNQWQDDGELLFEYFESDQPHQRRPLLEKIKQLIRGDTSSKSKPFGDPLKLERLNLHDLHPASWYSVAWYPIYRIPDGNFRATFLTYYSLGNFVRVASERPGSSGRLVSPVVGLQTYNAKGEGWFQPTVSKTKECDLSEIMEGRVKMLEQAAFVMARATVCKGNEKSVNRHPDFEFFLSRRS